MSATVIDGKAVAASVRKGVAAEVEELAAELGRPPGLATVLVGDDPASAIYVRRKREACEEVGIRSFHHEPDGAVSQEELLELVGDLNAAEEVDGILVQLPLPTRSTRRDRRRSHRTRTSTASPGQHRAARLARRRARAVHAAGLMELLQSHRGSLRGSVP